MTIKEYFKDSFPQKRIKVADKTKIQKFIFQIKNKLDKKFQFIFMKKKKN